MGKPCVVPKCRTGYKSEKKKISIFRVPKDLNRRKHWEEVIPGNLKLRPLQCVCSKHFEEKYIHREWIKYDPIDASKIIARSPYKYPQLSVHAVPTKFDEYVEVERAVESIESSPNVSTLKITVDGDVQSESPASTERLKVEPCVEDCVGACYHAAGSNAEEAFATIIKSSPDLDDDRSTDKDSLLVECGLAVFEETPDVKDIVIDQDHCTDNNEIVSSMDVTDPSQRANRNTTTYAVHSTLNVTEKNPSTSGRITVCQAYSAVIPKFWSAGELQVEEQQRVVFHYTVTKLTNGEKYPVVQKSVTLDEEKNFRYFVYGRRVETRATVLDRSLRDVTCVRTTLETFQRLGICNGLGLTDAIVPIEDAFVDFVQQWRHNDCTLISGKKRCSHCTKLRRRVKQREKYRASYGIDLLAYRLSS